jgi:hypothetical protein
LLRIGRSERDTECREGEFLALKKNITRLVFIILNLFFALSAGFVLFLVKISVTFSNFDSIVQMSSIPYLISIAIVAFILIHIANIVINWIFQKIYKEKKILLISFLSISTGLVIGSVI